MHFRALVSAAQLKRSVVNQLEEVRQHFRALVSAAQLKQWV